MTWYSQYSYLGLCMTWCTQSSSLELVLAEAVYFWLCMTWFSVASICRTLCSLWRLCSESGKTVEEVEVKWAGYPSTITTWEPGQHIKSFITSWYSADKTRYGRSIPEPTIKYTKEGSPGKVFHFLSFKMQSEIDAEHLPRSVFHLWEAGIPESRCKTRKDKDRRVNDHTQYALIPQPFAEALAQASLNPIAKHFTDNIVKVIDKLHFNVRSCRWLPLAIHPLVSTVSAFCNFYGLLSKMGCQQSVVLGLLPNVCCLQYVVYCLLFTICCQPTVCCLLYVVYRLLSTFCCIPSVRPHLEVLPALQVLILVLVHVLLVQVLVLVHVYS